MPRKTLPNSRAEFTGDTNRLSKEVSKFVNSIPELSLLPLYAKNNFEADLIVAARFASIGVPTPREDISRKTETLVILAADIHRSMKSAGLEVTNWRQDTTYRDPDNGESLFHRIFRGVAAAVESIVKGELVRQIALRDPIALSDRKDPIALSERKEKTRLEKQLKKYSLAVPRDAFRMKKRSDKVKFS